MAEEHVKVRIRFKPAESLPAGESMWARPIDAHDGGGTFELLNSSYYVPLAVRDVVRAELDGDGMLQVTDVVCPGPFLMSWAVCASEEKTQVAAVGDRWLQCGSSWSEGTNGVLVTVWNEGVTRSQVEEVLSGDLRAGRLIWSRVIDPDERLGEAQEDIEFTLDRERHFPDVSTSYWAADDPYWREHGLDSPDFLAYIQSLAGDDDEVASALEDGDHEKVREIVAFINDGPLW